jgi:hypothetical protein
MNISKKIIFDNKEYYVSEESFNDESIDKLFLYKDLELQNTVCNTFGLPKLISKDLLTGVVNETGAGYAVYGGSPGGFGNPSLGGKFFGRGTGFGQSSFGSGPNLMYTYTIKPLNQLLQQPGTNQDTNRYIHVGSEVTGIVLKTKEKIQGQIITIKEDNEKNIDYYIVLNNKTGIKYNVDPTSVKLINKETLNVPTLKDLTQENYFPSFKDFLNEDNSLNSFVRNQDPVKSLGLGYEGKIRNFFRQYNIPDEDYEVKKDGEIVFNKYLNLSNSQIRELPANLTVNRSLFLSNTQIRELPANLTVNGSLDLGNTQIRELPANLTIKVSLNLSNTQIKELPANLTVNGYLWLDSTQIRELPANLTIGDNILVNRDQTELINFIKHSKFKNKLEIKE